MAQRRKYAVSHLRRHDSPVRRRHGGASEHSRHGSERVRVLEVTEMPVLLALSASHPANAASPWRWRYGARSTALFPLATELPAAVLPRTLGSDITVSVSVTGQRAAAVDGSAYAAEGSRRNSS
ncbi:hypothetical protein RB200_06640 [Streptomyces sp. PmtG]